MKAPLLLFLFSLVASACAPLRYQAIVPRKDDGFDDQYILDTSTGDVWRRDCDKGGACRDTWVEMGKKPLPSATQSKR